MAARGRDFVRLVTALSFFAAAAATSLAGTPTSSAKALHDEGLAALRRRAAEPARQALKQLSDRHASSGHTHLLAGHCALVLEGNAARAEALYERACTSFASEGRADDDDAAEALHAFGRLFRQQSRWEEADAKYAAAVALRPADMTLKEEALFVRAKRLVVSFASGEGEEGADGGDGGDAQLREAASCFERGAASASALWRPHFAREAGHTRGLCGDAAAATRHYELALTLGALPDRSALADSLQTLAAHHEKRADLVAAAAFLRSARDAFAAAALATGADDADDAACKKVAAAHVRHAFAIEALYALGERRNECSGVAPSSSTTAAAAIVVGGGDGGGVAASARDALPLELATAAASYEAAIAVRPSVAAAYDGLACLLLGTSRLANYGATHAAALNAAEARTLLLAAQRIGADETQTAEEERWRLSDALSSWATLMRRRRRWLRGRA
jgi:tetratricopeptide (TPR) repeat protein